MSETFKIGQLADGKMKVIGSITFEKGKGTLSFETTGADADRLKAAWADVAGRDTLIVRRSEDVIEEDGSESHNLYGIQVSKGDADYPEAAADFLANNNGYFVLPE